MNEHESQMNDLNKHWKKKPKLPKQRKNKRIKVIVNKSTLPKKVKGKFTKEEMNVPIYFNVINNKNFRIKHRGKLSLYLFLRATAIRKNPHKEWNTIPQRIYDRFGTEGKIAAAWSQEDLAEMFGYAKSSTSSIVRWLDELWEEGAIVIDTLESDKPEPLNVYILGEWVDGNQWYYFDLVNSGSKAISVEVTTEMVTMQSPPK